MVVGAQVAGDRAGVAALVEARVLEADRERPHVPRRLDLAQRGRDARGIDPARQEDPDRHVRPPVPRHRVAKFRPEPLGRGAEVEQCGSTPCRGGFQYRADAQSAPLPTSAHGRRAASGATARSSTGPAHTRRKGSAPGSARSSARLMSGCARIALGSEPNARPPPGSAP